MNEQFATAIRNTPLLSGLGEQEITRLASHAVFRKCEKKETLFLEGDKIEGFYLVLSGMIKIYKISADGKEHVFHLVGRGQTFAEGALFGFKGFPAGAEAVEDSEVLLIPREEFIQMLSSDPQLCHGLFKELSLWLRRLSDIIYSLAFRDIEKRMASYFVRQCREEHGGVEDGMSFNIGIEKSLLASYLGTIPETFSRTLKKLHGQGLIEVRGSEITILDADGLLALVELE